MRVRLNSVSGVDDAIAALHESKRTWSWEMDEEIRTIIEKATDRHGRFKSNSLLTNEEEVKLSGWMRKVCKFGIKHITLLKFIDFSFCVEGMHRGGQDDWDSHAKRFDNRIIRASTRLASYGDEKSDYYKGKILTTDDVIRHLAIAMPPEVTVDGEKYVRAVNGYIREGLEGINDVKRGLYMLSIPSNFIFRVNLAEFAHVYKERGLHGTAHAEVKGLAETCAMLIEEAVPWFTRELLMEIKN